MGAITGMGIIEKISFGDDVTCRPQKPLPPLSSLVSLPSGYRELLEPEPWPDRLFFHPSLAPIFFQLLPSRAVRGLVPGETSKPTLDVGGVLGGVIGSKADPDGDGESVLSSVMLSGASADDVPEDPDM